MHRGVLVAAGVLVVLLAAQTALILTSSPMLPVRVETLLPEGAATPVDAHLDLARQHAPWLMQETDDTLGRQDIPVAMDLDGDRDATNDWEHLPAFTLLPTAYYTVVETETHVFLTYHFYYPRAWSRLPLGLGGSHEGDGANVQVVVDKRTSEPVILATQSGGEAFAYASTRGPIANGAEPLRSDFEVTLGHPVVYAKSGGHDLYGSHDPRAANRLAHAAAPVLAYRPAEDGENVTEPEAPWLETARYRLVSLPMFLGNATDHPDLFADQEERAPRYHRGDRYAGPLGPSRGISPFAFGFEDDAHGFDALFWDPARAYAEAFKISGNWSREYTHRSFATA